MKPVFLIRFTVCLLTLWVGMYLWISDANAADSSATTSQSTGQTSSGTATGSATNSAASQAGVRTLITPSPGSLEPYTLVVPLPNQKSPPLVLKKQSVETVPNTQPAMPQSSTGLNKDDETNTQNTLKTRPIAPVVY